eukprot:CAMPEP_0174370038 /NCGR_PEP_ID=MMETSP0811_2-20130205/94747_1 /TAXON_ID=73025 ORGANISM="Eutreptiella gymnastica-like, Strain CCMP1594" /NCGR_SAMPLE_ID=MMETSP0811_2 /ASSEMBLY_ACC=CAM_ASM_000667 /LENGTH=70 /DNA_ID=CAMNT_0015515089 /DNA_START=143 /DNA_END=356 /DNA_ORIENTATION=+
MVCHVGGNDVANGEINGSWDKGAPELTYRVWYDTQHGGKIFLHDAGQPSFFQEQAKSLANAPTQVVALGG